MLQNMDANDKALMEEDRRYFAAADVNGDGRLSAEEYDAFQNPEHYKHMHAALVTVRCLMHEIRY